MSFLFRIPRILWKLGLVWTFIVIPLVLFEAPYPSFLSWLRYLGWFVLLDTTMYIGVGQLMGSFYANIRTGFKPPSEANYDCKADYILPFEGKWTAVNGGVSKGLSHSWGIVTQRYAYDFVIMDDEGKSFAGDNTKLRSYFCYGINIIAPADGVVVKVSDSHRDSRVTGRKVFCDTWDIRGNFVLIKHAENEYSFCAHFIPGSVTVKAGDNVKQSDVIGRCGNSGNTSEPHLHFHLQSSKSFFFSAGLPISFVRINAREKANYGKKDSRGPQKEPIKARGNGRVYIGRGLEIENEGI